MILKALRVLSIIATFFCVGRAGVFACPIWLLSVLYSLFLVFLRFNRSLYILRDSPGLLALFIAMFGRYIIVPFAYYYTREYNFMASTYQFMEEAVFLMVYEQICVFITIWLCVKKVNNNILVKPFSITRIKYEKFFFVCAIVSFIFIAINYKSLGEGMSVLQSGDLTAFSDINSPIESGSAYINIIWQALCVWLYVYLVIRQRSCYEKDSRNKRIIISIIYTYILILLSFIDQTGLSRWYTIVMVGSCLAFLNHLYPKRKNIINKFILIPAIVLLVLATMIKNLGYSSVGAHVDSSVVEAASSSLFDAYFAGPTNVNSSIALAMESDLGAANIINDALNNMPIVNHFLNPNRTTVYQFNDMLGRIEPFRESGDQIIPLVGQSLIYFGVLLAPLLSVLSVLITFYFDEKFRRDYSYLSFCYGLIAIWFGVEAMMLNLTINFSWIYIRIFPFWVFLFLSNKHSIKSILNTPTISNIKK